MKYLILAFLALALPAGAAEADPLSGNHMSLMDEIGKKKTYALDIVYGETPNALPSKNSRAVISDDFLKAAKRISTGTDLGDSGIIEREGGTTLAYKIKNFETEFVLDVSFTTRDTDGGSAINTSLSLRPAEWVSLGASSRHESRKLTSGDTASSQVYSYVFARIQKRG